LVGETVTPTRTMWSMYAFKAAGIEKLNMGVPIKSRSARKVGLCEVSNDNRSAWIRGPPRLNVDGRELARGRVIETRTDLNDEKCGHWFCLQRAFAKRRLARRRTHTDRGEWVRPLPGAHLGALTHEEN
jgi:hypothetical protein